MESTVIKLRGYKDALEEMNKQKTMILTISLWTYSSGRMTFKVQFDDIKHCFDWDMILVGKKGKVSFVTIEGKEFSYHYDKLKIAKLDYVELQTTEEE